MANNNFKKTIFKQALSVYTKDRLSGFHISPEKATLAKISVLDGIYSVKKFIGNTR